ncbi:aromatic ring-hydroxylating oxygenase subunit alpha [Hypericibacter sp.]|uniref:aromatic ring-hydroxylating oxygenase subunit alpha n=1 Tax=Hypericibacter sp. TaxID=2705401 RepID=UPI003D6C8A65
MSAKLTTTLDSDWYVDPGIYAREMAAIFGREWLLVGHRHELAQPGAYLAMELAGRHVFVLAGRDGVLKAFHNVCRHRAARLLPEGNGRCGVLRCPYHGWVYDHDGRLKKRPGFADEENFDGAALGLFPVRVEEWRGFVFVNLDPEAGDLLSGLGDMAVATRDVPLERYRFHKRQSYELDFNWKTYTDNYLDAYHIPYLHPQLAADLDMATYRVVNGDRVSVHHAAPRVKASAGENGAYQGLFMWRWPNNSLGVYGGGFNICRILPQSVSRLRLLFDFYFDPQAGFSEAEKDRKAATTCQVVEEDFPICSQVQRNLEVGIYRSGPLNPRLETGVAYFHDLVRRAVGNRP